MLDSVTLPADWEVTKLSRCLEREPDYGINAAAAPFGSSSYRYLRITDISEEGRYVPDPPVSVVDPRADRYLLEEGDLVFARTGASVGKSYLYKGEVPNLVFAGFLIRVRTDTSSLNPQFLAYYVQSSHYWAWVETVSMRTGQPGINGPQYSEMPLPLPPLPEQRAIATVLSDVDALIDSLDALIAKKRAIKTAAMQQLLTGRRRLPGFGGEWATREFVQIVERLNLRGRKIQTDEYSAHGPFPIVDQGKGLVAGYTDREELLIRAPAGGLIVFGDHTRILKFVDFDFVAGADGTQVLQTSRDCSARFVCYRLSLVTIPSGGYDRHFKYLKETRFSVPEKEEQQAIATVLSDVDAEIAALEMRREKTRQIKQGMMQELLTGRTRLLSPQSEPARMVAEPSESYG